MAEEKTKKQPSKYKKNHKRVLKQKNSIETLIDKTKEDIKKIRNETEEMIKKEISLDWR